MVHCSSWLGSSWDLEDIVISARQQPVESACNTLHSRARRDRFRSKKGPSREQLQVDRLLAVFLSIPRPPSQLHFQAPTTEHHLHLQQKAGADSSEWWPFSAVHQFPDSSGLDIDWQALPATADPVRGGGYKRGRSDDAASGHGHMERGDRKKWQVSSIARVLDSFQLQPESVVVDFGCGSGALTLPLAAIFPKLVFLGLDFKQKSVDLLQWRAREAGLRNVRACCGRIEDFVQPFQACVALHACGSATDMALVQALARRSAYIMSPCCVGKLQLTCRGASPQLVYPRSRWLRSSISVQEFGLLARAADWSSYDHEKASSQLHTLCKVLVELDRQEASREEGYTTSLLALPNAGAGVVGISHVLVGRPGNNVPTESV